MTTATDERRLHQRFKLTPMHAPVVVHCVDHLAIERREGHAYDISESGMRLELDDPLEKGQHVSLCLELPGQQTQLSVSGLVVWVNDAEDDPGPRRLAVHFTEFAGESEKVKLLTYVGASSQRLAA